MNNSTIFITDLEPLNEALGLPHRARNLQSNTPLMFGEFRFHTFPGGLSMHASNALELQDSDNILALPAGLSFNLVFKGSVDFSYGNMRYRMSASERTKAASCTAIINNSDEILTRHMRKDVAIEKLNIFAEKHWLSARCKSPEDKQLLAKLFANNGVLQWQASDKMVALAFELLGARSADSQHHPTKGLRSEDDFEKAQTSTFQKSSSLSHELKIEHLSVSLLSECLSALEQELARKPLPLQQEKTIADSTSDKMLKARIDEALPFCHSINDLADSLHISTRSLQRRFKQHYQMQVSDYVKQRRMDVAKKALMIDGLSIKEASYKAGYTYPSNFVSAFKKLYGLTPNNYRKMHDTES